MIQCVCVGSSFEFDSGENLFIDLACRLLLPHDDDFEFETEEKPESLTE